MYCMTILQSLQCLFNISKKKLGEVDILHADTHQSFLQVEFNHLGIKVSYKVILSLWMGMIKHSQSTQSKEFAIYLKKEVRDGVHFLHADKHQSFYKLALSFLMEVARHVQSTQNKKLLNKNMIKQNFIRVIKYFSVATAFLLCCDA